MNRHTTAGPFSPAPATSKATACEASVDIDGTPMVGYKARIRPSPLAKATLRISFDRCRGGAVR